MSYYEGKHKLPPVWVGGKLDTFAYFLQNNINWCCFPASNFDYLTLISKMYVGIL